MRIGIGPDCYRARPTPRSVLVQIRKPPTAVACLVEKSKGCGPLTCDPGGWNRVSGGCARPIPPQD